MLCDGPQTTCWLGSNRMTEPPHDSRCPECEDLCWGKEVSVTPVSIRQHTLTSSDRLAKSTRSFNCYPKSLQSYAIDIKVRRQRGEVHLC